LEEAEKRKHENNFYIRTTYYKQDVVLICDVYERRS